MRQWPKRPGVCICCVAGLTPQNDTTTAEQSTRQVHSGCALCDKLRGRQNCSKQACAVVAALRDPPPHGQVLLPTFGTTCGPRPVSCTTSGVKARPCLSTTSHTCSACVRPSIREHACSPKLLQLFRSEPRLTALSGATRGSQGRTNHTGQLVVFHPTQPTPPAAPTVTTQVQSPGHAALPAPPHLCHKRLHTKHKTVLRTPHALATVPYCLRHNLFCSCYLATCPVTHPQAPVLVSWRPPLTCATKVSTLGIAAATAATFLRLGTSRVGSRSSNTMHMSCDQQQQQRQLDRNHDSSTANSTAVSHTLAKRVRGLDLGFVQTPAH